MPAALSRITSLFAALALVSTAACSTTTLVGSGVPKTETRPIEGVRALVVHLPGKVDVTQGATESLTITADDNVLPEIESKVDGGVLKLAFRKATNLRSATIRIALGVKTLESVSINGSGDVHTGALKSPTLKITINGSGDVKLGAIDAEKFDATIRGSGDIHASGRVKALDISIAGSGDVKLAQMQADQVKVGIAGSGDAQVWARDVLTVRVAGSGDVRYYGDPTVDQSVLGSGRIKRLGPAPG